MVELTDFIPASYLRLAKWGALVLGAFGLLGYGYHLGYGNATTLCKANLAGSIARAAEQARQIALQDAEVSADVARTITKIRTVERPIEVEVIREIPTDCTLCAVTPRARGLLNDALSGRAFQAPGAGEPARPVPPPIAPPVWQLPGNHPEARRNFSPVI